MKKLFRFVALTTLAASALGHVHAQTPDADGEVRKIDKAQAKITLRHGEIKNLDMPPMTMVFRVKDPAWLDTLAVGDKIRFQVEKIDGQYTVTAVRKP
jgi:Cu(I)/Ag(I) efflux system periplasmic protein CusF